MDHVKRTGGTNLLIFLTIAVMVAGSVGVAWYLTRGADGAKSRNVPPGDVEPNPSEAKTPQSQITNLTTQPNDQPRTVKPIPPDGDNTRTQIANTVTAQSFIAKGDKAFRDGDYDLAQEYYESACATTPTAELKAKIAACADQAKLKIATESRKREEYEKAKGFLEELRRTARPRDDKTTPSDVDLIFDARMNLAEEARLKKNWAEALAQLEAAKKLKPDSEEVKEAIRHVHRDEYLEKAKAARDAGDLATARAYANLAMSYGWKPEIEECPSPGQ
jgi:tetratricopeptide (TPR) repeat protein